MKIKASLKYLRISPRKVRLITNLIKGMNVEEAKIRLQLLIQRASRPLLKLLNSAVASAKHDFDIEEKNLYISKIITNEGPTFKRSRARARGIAFPIMKRTSHVILELEEKVPLKKRPAKKKPKVAPEKTPETPTKKISETLEKPKIPEKKPQIKKKPEKKDFLGKERLKQIGKRIFRRKSM